MCILGPIQEGFPGEPMTILAFPLYLLAEISDMIEPGPKIDKMMHCDTFSRADTIRLGGNRPRKKGELIRNVA